MSLVSRSVLSYPDQVKLLDYYKKKSAEGDEQMLNGKSLTKLQEDSLISKQQFHEKRTVVRKVFRTTITEQEKSQNSPVEVYDAGQPFVLLFSNKPNKTAPNNVASDVFNRLVIADTFYRNFCGVPPIATRPNLIKGYVNDPDEVHNASWNGQNFRFGITDPLLFADWTDEDLVLHEVGHAVTDFTTDFEYKGQSGALNESASDVFAIIHKHQSKGTLANAEDADWEFARIARCQDGKLYPLRSLRNPGKAFTNHDVLTDTQVWDAALYIHEPNPSEENDNGGVHAYSGIPNHAFYLAATGISDYSYRAAGEIWWKTMQKCETTDGFEEFAINTIDIAKTSYSSAIANEVQKAWTTVNVNCSYRRTVSKKIAKVYQCMPTSTLVKGIGLIGLGVAGTLLTQAGVYSYIN